MSEIVKSEYNALGEDNNYKTHFFKTSADQVVGLGRMKNTEYQVGDVVYSDTNNKVALKCTQAGTTSNTELDISGRAVGESVEDGTCVWKLVSRVSDGMPVGFKYFDWVKEIPVGALGALGALYNRELYADLWKSAQENKQVITEAEWQALAQANDGNVPWYSDGDGSTTFRVPALKCWVKGASGIEEVGNYLEAGLPNIVGDAGTSLATGGRNENNTTGTGAMWFDGREYYFPGGAGYFPYGYLSFDASHCNPIYGNSDTVQPPSLIGIWLIKAFGTVTNVGNADVANVMQAVEQVQTQVGAIEQTLPQKANLGALSMPSGNYIQLDTSLTSYTAPTDGWVHCSVGFSNEKNYHEIMCTRGNYASYLLTSINWDWVSHMLPIPKGATVTFTKSAGCVLREYAFFYAQSEV